jgi:hypothetical protein
MTEPYYTFFDAQSENLSSLLGQAYSSRIILGASKPDGSALVENVKMTGVTNRQLKQLMVEGTPKHPETELRKANAKYEHESGLIDMFKSHIVIDAEHLIVTGQNQKATQHLIPISIFPSLCHFCRINTLMGL